MNENQGVSVQNTEEKKRNSRGFNALPWTLLAIVLLVVAAWMIWGGNFPGTPSNNNRTGAAATPAATPTAALRATATPAPAVPANEGAVMLTNAQFNALLESLTVGGQSATEAPKATDAAQAAPTADTSAQAAKPEVEVEAPGNTPLDLVPSVPVLAQVGQNIIAVADAALAAGGPKVSVYPRVIFGGDYNPEENRETWKTALLEGAPVSLGTDDIWSVFSYAGREGDNGAWFFPLTEETKDLADLRRGSIQETVYMNKVTSTITSPTVRLDAMMALNIVEVQNVGVRALTKNPGIVSVVLIDGETEGLVRLGFAVPPAFVNNFTGGAQDVVPAVIINGQPGRAVLLERFGADGALVSSETGEIETVNGTLTFEVPSNGSFVVLSMHIVGAGENSNPEVLFRMGSQPLSDIEGKNWHPAQ